MKRMKMRGINQLTNRCSMGILTPWRCGKYRDIDKEIQGYSLTTMNIYYIFHKQNSIIVNNYWSLQNQQKYSVKYKTQVGVTQRWFCSDKKWITKTINNLSIAYKWHNFTFWNPQMSHYRCRCEDYNVINRSENIAHNFFFWCLHFFALNSSAHRLQLC